MPGDTPRYAQIFHTLSKRMQAGEYPVDMRLPTESELCDEFNASRFTVREALRRLVEQGMVQRRQGAGSVVVSTTPQARYVHSLSSLNDLFQFALDTHYDLLSIEPVTLDTRTAADLGVEAGERWQLVEGLRRHEKGGKAFCYVCSYIAPRARAYVRELRRCVGPFYAHLANQTGEDILEVRQDIFGAPMTAKVAAGLDCKADTISTCAFRRYITRKGTLIASYNWHVADQFYYRMKMSRAMTG
ncbi:MAG: GntR family transcriptional regulator [Alphaproteobacteria bacterium]|nr:GntR family transcriptional regulator [Alphaproteobacteria bacterium]